MEPRASDTVAAKIRDLRELLGWSRREMAERCGLSESVVENIESGRPGDDGNRRRDVTIDELLIIARALDVSLANLLPERATERGGYEREEARKKRREREAAIAEHAKMIGKYEGHLQELRHQHMKMAKEIQDHEREVEIRRQKIAALRAERD
jgi:transcriptional regulator with XRE-family HTH domain